VTAEYFHGTFAYEIYFYGNENANSTPPFSGDEEDIRPCRKWMD
jgi:hypothetical protein